MRANAFVAVLICIAVFLAGCSADMNSTESDTDFKGAETTVQTNQNDTEQYTQDTEISDVINDTAFGDYGRLIFPVNSSYYSGDTLGELGLTWYNNIDPNKTVEIANYMKSHAENGDVIFYDIYTDEEKAADPAKEDTGLFFFKGNPGERFAVCNAGGGFAYVGAMHDSFPHALELSKMGYNAFALIYRPGAQTACEDLARAISFIFENADELEVNTDCYSLWGGSAGGRMAAWLGSYGTAAFGEKDLPQAGAVIMQYTGHSEYSESDPPTYACVGENDGIIAPCHAYYFCREHGGECAYKDDMAEILQAMIDADVLVLASPVYFYSIDAQLKAVIDRTVARWLEVKNKEFYYIMTAADEDKSSMDTTLACFRGYADCVNGAKEMGVIYGTGVYEKGKVLNTPAMAEAYEMGKNV